MLHNFSSSTGLSLLIKVANPVEGVTDIAMLRTVKRLMLLRPELRERTKIMQPRKKLTDMQIFHIPLMVKLVSIK